MKEKRNKGRMYYKDSIEMEIDSRFYEVYNISSDGFCIFSEDPKIFNVGDILSPIKLEFIDSEATIMGKVMHITPFTDEETHERSLWMIGIKFVPQENNNEYFKKQYEDLNVLKSDSIEGDN